MNILFGRCKKFEVNNADSTYKVHYLGNVMTSLLKNSFNIYNNTSLNLNPSTRKGKYLNKLIEEQNHVSINESQTSMENSQEDDDFENYYENSTNMLLNSVDKSVKILWENHLKHNGHAGLKMRLTLTQGGLRVDTKDHGVTEYYGHRIHFVQAHPLHPKLFIWVYQHVGKNLKSEIRCHAALCQKTRDAKSIQFLLINRIQQTFLEYKREKRRQQNSRLCNTKNGGLLLKNQKRTNRITHNYKPPAQHGMSSAPKLDDLIEEEEEEEEEELEVEEYINSINEKEEVITNISDESDESDVEIQNLEANMANLMNTEEEEDDTFMLFESSTDTNTCSSLHTEKYENSRPMTQQLILSESSHTTTSSTSSSNSSISNSPSPNHDINVDNQLSSTDDSGIELNKYNLEKNAINISTDNEKSFTEVSYDFLSDLSKTNEINNGKLLKRHSQSFNKHSSYNKYANFEYSNNSNFLSSFRSRSINISKSFSAFTSRFKHQQQQRHNSRTLETTNSAQKSTNDTINEQQVKTILSTSRGSSPTLSSCSYTSSSTTSNNNKLLSAKQQATVDQAKGDSNDAISNLHELIISL